MTKDAPIRAFLMLRSSNGRWQVNDCHNLAAVMRSWEARRLPNLDIGVLHIGFDRPPPKIFDDVAELYPGRMLLTGAAKHAMPSSFPCSAAPIGCAKNIDVFMGLKGWGYTLDDPAQETDYVKGRQQESDYKKTAQKESDQIRETQQKLGRIKETQRESDDMKETRQKSDHIKGMQHHSATPVPHPWVASFLAEFPKYNEVLAKHRISDDADYLEREVKLNKSLRHRLGLFRLHYVVGRNCDDICAIARAAPPWMRIRELGTLRMRARPLNVFRNNGIETVEELADWSSEALLKLKNFGLDSYRQAMLATINILEEGPMETASYDALSQSDNLLTQVRDSLLVLPARNRDIYIRRMGFETPPQTLMGIANDYGLTRERIRQILKFEIGAWLLDSAWPEIFKHKVSRIFGERSSPLQVADFEAIDCWFKGVSEHEIFFSNLVRTLFDKRLRLISIDNLNFFGSMDQESWHRMRTKAAELLISAVDSEWTEEHTRLQIQGLLPDDANCLGILLWDSVSRLCHFSVTADGSRILTGYGRGARYLVETILRESEKPLHYKEIARQVKERFGKNINSGTLRYYATNVGFLFGLGIYGVEQHVMFTKRQMAKIRREAEDIIYADDSGRQWHSSELLSELLERLSSSYSTLDKYVLNIALSDSSILGYLGRMTWTAVTDDTDNPSRIEVNHAVVDILRAAGRLLSKDEIRERLAVRRGTNSTFHIFEIYPLVRFERGFWGLNDRDVPISRKQQRELIEKLVQCLEEKQSGIHQTELSGVLRLHDCPLVAFVSIATQDKRLRHSRTKYLYLAKWGSPRRESIFQAASAVLEGSRESLTVAELAFAVENRLGRELSKSCRARLYSALKSLDTKLERKVRRKAVG